MRACSPDWGELLAGLGRNKGQALEKAEKVSEESAQVGPRVADRKRIPANTDLLARKGSHQKARNVPLSDRCQCRNRRTQVGH